MSLAAGTKIGPYEITAALGAGGMGEVYRARDERLNRQVAVKLLPAGMAQDAERQRRFEQEARAVAALNHPNILAIYDVGTWQDQAYLVTELLEGESLRQRLRTGAMAPRKVADIGAQIAAGLAAAHQRGIVHRDLKPENIFVTRDERVKILDFGLAKAAPAGSETAPQAAAEGYTPSTVPTLAASTLPGMVLGTVGYMAPEQARGDAADARSDIFSLGAVLYEMATGARAFHKDSGIDTMHAILHEEPRELTAGGRDLPPGLTRIIERCLEKSPERRLQSAGDVAFALEGLSGSGSGTQLGGMAAAGGGAHRGWAATLRRWWPVAGVVVAAALAWFAAARHYAGNYAASAGAAVYRLRQVTFSGRVQNAAISRDGQFVAYTEATPAGVSLHTLAIATAGAAGSDVQIVPPGHGCCLAPAFTPNGSRVYFLANSWIESVPLLGGPVRKIIGDACGGVGFSPHGRRIAFIRAVANGAGSTDMVLANADGSAARVLAKGPPAQGFTCYSYGGGGTVVPAPIWSPDGHRIAAATFGSNGPGNTGFLDRFVTVSVGHGRIRAVANSAADNNYSGLAWAGNRALLASTGVHATSASQIWRIALPNGHLLPITSSLGGYAGLSAAASGAWVTLHSAPQYAVAVGRPGAGRSAFRVISAANPTFQSELAWTSNGRLLLTRDLGGREQLWIENADGGQSSPVVTDRRLAPVGPAAAPGGEIVFVDARGSGIWRVHADGSGLQRLTPGTATFGLAGDPALAPGGKEVTFNWVGHDGKQRLASVPLAGGKVRVLWPGMVLADGIAVSPRGRRVFLVSQTRQGAHQPLLLDLTKTPPAATRMPPFFLEQADYASGQYAWTPDGKAISYVRRQGLVDNLWAMPVAGGSPRELTHFTRGRIAGYAWSQDGRLAISRGDDNTDVVLAMPRK